MVDRFVGWKVTRQHRLGTATHQQIEDGIEDGSPIDCARTTTGFSRGDEGFDQLPLPIAEVGGIGFV